jgi:hypothetical protein
VKIGYTHYWTIKSSIKDKFPEFADDCKKVLDHEIKNGTKLAFECTIDSKPPLTNNNTVRFNGVGEEGHETFLISASEIGFQFCKTARKPYDTAVTACLLLARHHFGSAIEMSSDGGSNGFNRAFLVLSRVFPDTKFLENQNWYGEKADK